MIDLYAIINEGSKMQLYVRDGKNQKQMESLLNHILKKITNKSSKIIKTMSIHTYNVYYFGQASFTFILATEIKEGVSRMQNYLRVVADIFYENYDERKFHYILDRIIGEINRVQFGGKVKEHNLQDEESLLVNDNINEGKNKINYILQKRNQESRRAYIIITVLFLIIMALGIFYLKNKWN